MPKKNQRITDILLLGNRKKLQKAYAMTEKIGQNLFWPDAISILKLSNKITFSKHAKEYNPRE